MTTVITVETDDEALWWTLQHLTRSTAVEAAFVCECVALGVVDVSGSEAEWRFDAAARARLQRAWRLHRDLELQAQALPLVLELLEEVDALRSEVQFLRSRLRHWETGQD